MRSALLACALACALTGAAVADAGPDLRTILSGRPAPLLSEYRLFADMAAQTPAAGVTPYALETPLFSDYALKRRYIYLPPGARARVRGEDVFDFPVGTVLVKTFAFPADLRRPEENVRTIETRLLVRRRDAWETLVYVWDAAGRDAQLQPAGMQTPVRFIDAAGATRDITYAVPNKNQCRGCHEHAGAVTPIGPKPRSLGQDQLAKLQAAAVLDAAPPPAPPLTSLDAQARAYLDVNCAHCHSPGGPADNSGLDLRFEQNDPARWGVRKRPVAAGRASAGLLFSIDPGQPETSILLHRMRSTDPGVMMPELGRTLAHDEGVALISRWIAAMDPNGRVAPSP